jgi:hypothetical protein
MMVQLANLVQQEQGVVQLVVLLAQLATCQ